MADTIIILVVVVILIFALKGSIRHFRGEGACCGGGSGSVKTKKAKKKTLDGPVTGQREVSFDRTVDDADLKQAVEKAGFEVVSIS